MDYSTEYVRQFETPHGTFKVRLSDLQFKSYSIGNRACVTYELFHDGDLILKGSDLEIPSHKVAFSDETIATLFSFLSYYAADEMPDDMPEDAAKWLVTYQDEIETIRCCDLEEYL